MDYIKTFEYYIFGFNKKPKKPDNWDAIEYTVRQILYKIDDINKEFHLSHVNNVLQYVDNDHVKKFMKLHDILSKYDFITQIDGVYKFDIKKFISGSYNQLIDVDKNDREMFGKLLEFFVDYYKFRKSMYRKCDVFVENPIVSDEQIVNIMKKINK